VLNANLAIVGGVFPFSGSLTYAYGTWRGRVVPNRVTWSLWTVIPIIVGVAEVTNGAGTASVFAFGAGIGPGVVLLASLRRHASYWRLVPFDVGCGACSVVALVLWALTRDADIAIVLNILADFLAAVPTIMKAVSHPMTESAWTFVLSAVGAVIVLLTVTRWDVANVAFQLYALIVCVLLGLIIGVGRHRARPEAAPPKARA
jgi:hypothetical protein